MPGKNLLSLQDSSESIKVSAREDASVSIGKNVLGRSTTGYSAAIPHHSVAGPVHDDIVSHRRYRSKSAHTNKFRHVIESSRAKPNGVLAIHIKSGEIHDIDLSGEVFPTGAPLFVYLRILCIDYVKYSRVYVVEDTPTTIIFDELKHFYINVGSMKPDSFCFVRFEILAFEESKRSVHRVFATKEISLLQLIKCMYGSASLELWRDERQVAEIEIEACFATGAFGFGYSSLFDFPDHGPKAQLAWSMFCRLPPPPDRTEARNPGSNAELIACRETPRPGVIYFTRIALLKPLGRFSSTLLAAEPPSPLIGGLVGRRLAERQAAFSQLKTRHDRLKYLREFVIHPFSQMEETLISEDVHYFKEINIRRTTIQSTDGRARFSIFTKEREDRTDPGLVHVIGPEMGKSPGVIRRRQGNDSSENLQKTLAGHTEDLQKTPAGHTEDQKTPAGHTEDQKTPAGHTEDLQKAPAGHTEDLQKTQEHQEDLKSGQQGRPSTEI